MVSIDGEQLSPRHLAELKASAISDEQIAARGYETISNPRALPPTFTGSLRVPSLYFPIRNTQGETVAGQLKPDRERLDWDGWQAGQVPDGWPDVPGRAGSRQSRARVVTMSASSG